MILCLSVLKAPCCPSVFSTLLHTVGNIITHHYVHLSKTRLVRLHYHTISACLQPDRLIQQELLY